MGRHLELDNTGRLRVVEGDAPSFSGVTRIVVDGKGKTAEVSTTQQEDILPDFNPATGRLEYRQAVIINAKGEKKRVK